LQNVLKFGYGVFERLLMMELPLEFTNRMKRLLGDEYTDFISSYANKNTSGLRINTLKISVDDFLNIDPFSSTEAVPYIGNGLYYDEDKDKPSKHPYYHAGLYYIQEPSAMLPATLLPVASGDRVLDLCAAPGGKCTELAAKLRGEGILVANDISNSRAKALLKNIELFGIKNTIVMSEAPIRLAERFGGYFDKILVDAPCSGEGMFRRAPSVVKNWEQYGVGYYAKLQRDILPSAVRMLKQGGYLLYSTCTFSPEENEGTVNWLLNKYPEMGVVDAVYSDMINNTTSNDTTSNNIYYGFSHGRPEWIVDMAKRDGEHVYGDMLKKCIRLFPHKIRGEGHFVALLRKEGEGEVAKEGKNGTIRMNCQYNDDDEQIDKKNKNKTNTKLINNETIEFLNKLKLPINMDHIMVKDSKVYLLPDEIRDLEGLRILRSGLLLGEQLKGRFEPSQALACALKLYEYDSVYDFDVADEDVIRYLKCESLELKDKTYNKASNKTKDVIICNEASNITNNETSNTISSEASDVGNGINDVINKKRINNMKDGWVLVCVDGFPLGFGKAKDGMLKNKYLPGWRMM